MMRPRYASVLPPPVGNQEHVADVEMRPQVWLGGKVSLAGAQGWELTDLENDLEQSPGLELPARRLRRVDAMKHFVGGLESGEEALVVT